MLDCVFFFRGLGGGVRGWARRQVRVAGGRVAALGGGGDVWWGGVIYSEK